MSFDVAVARLTVDLAKLAYRDAVAAEAGAAGHGLGEFRFFDGATSTQAFTAADVTRRVLSFRGTESNNPRDWVVDSQFRPRPAALGSVHSGFDGALDEVWESVLEEIAQDPRQLIITGHSLGGGLAILAAARLADSGRPPAAVYVYGCPRTGLSGFRDGYDAGLRDVTFRIINHIDIVTRVPLLVQGYRAPGRRMYFDRDGAFHPDAGAWQIAKDDLVYRLTNFRSIKALGLSTHEIDAYLERVATL
jgi:triacylglycerol lipase